MTDYQTFTTKDMPLEKRRALGVGDIWSNAATCHECGTTVRSRNRHDAVYCECKKLMVDGGSWYASRLYRGDTGFWDNKIELYDDVEQESPTS